jgi:hypothetical protein
MNMFKHTVILDYGDSQTYLDSVGPNCAIGLVADAINEYHIGDKQIKKVTVEITPVESKTIASIANV